MADFRTHITISSTLGIAYGSAAYLVFNLPPEHCVLAAGLCGLAGMLPDLDSETGVPVRETLCLVSAIVPVLVIPRLRTMGLAPELMVLAAAGIYCFIRFGVGTWFKRYTKHRGMWHSVPAAIIAGMVTFLLCLGGDLTIRLFKAWAVMIGFMSHLLLDEIYSVDLRGRRIKKSFGSALKFFSPRLWPNISTYGKIALLGVLIAGDAALMNHLGHDPIEIPWTAQDWLHNWFAGDEEQTHFR